MSNTLHKVYWVDDGQPEYESLAKLLESEEIKLVPFSHPADFLEKCTPDIRGCAILEHKLPGMDGIGLLWEMHKRGFSLPVIFLASHGTIRAAVQSIKAGALDFYTKPVCNKDFLSIILAALERDALEYQSKQEQISMRCKLATLTEREREIMILAVKGYTNKEIAQQLMISHRTVEIHRARILQKTGTANLLELVRRSGLMRNPYHINELIPCGHE